MGGDFTGHAHATRSQGLPDRSDKMDNNYGDFEDKTPPEHECFDKPGALAATWIDDLCKKPLDGKLGCDPGIPHTLVMISSQSRPYESGPVVCLCVTCKKTLTIEITIPGQCCVNRPDRMHHIVTGQLDEAPQPSSTDNYPVIFDTSMLCSAKDCSLVIRIRVCQPRFPREWEKRLLDRQAVAERVKRLAEDDPSRYEKLVQPDTKLRLVPAYYLQTYIKDALRDHVKIAAGVPPTKVSLRNKFYVSNFGTDFIPLFRQLGFEVIQQEEEMLQLPSVEPPPPGDAPTPYSSKRAQLEVVRAHLYCLLLNEPQPLVDQLQRGPDPVELRPVEDTLTTLLQASYTPTTFRYVEDYSSDAFHVLGAKRDFPESLLWYAAVTQNQTNPHGREAVYQALRTVSNNRERLCGMLHAFLEEEQMWSARQMSSETPLVRDYKFFNLQNTCTDEDLMASFHKIKGTWDQATERVSRQKLWHISQERKSALLEGCACAFDEEDEAPQEAAQYLGVDLKNTEPPSAVAVIIDCAKEDWYEKRIVAAATRLLAKYHTGHPDVSVLQDHVKVLTEALANDTVTDDVIGSCNVDASRPCGLTNIRNTCYLNSLLQYFKTVVPVRNVILDRATHKLETISIGNRRLVGRHAPLTSAEAFLAGKMVDEMHKLFVELESSNSAAVRPKRRLALAALLDEPKLVQAYTDNLSKKSIGPELPPALPPRSSSNPPVCPPVQPRISESPVDDNTDAGSNASSVTLGGQDGDDDDKTYVKLSDSIPPAVPAKERSALEEDDIKPELRGRSAIREGDVDMPMPDTNAPANCTHEVRILTVEEKIEHALNDVGENGTEQQDFEEVMGNILGNFQAANGQFSTDPSGVQSDTITDTFYWTYTQHTRDLDLKTGQAIGEPRIQKQISRWLTAFPGSEGKVDLYTALDRSFDREHPDEGIKETFGSITREPPILHIYLQRAQQEANGHVSKNNNIVEIPETLYLDRYMDGGADSDIMKRRQRSWNLKGRLQALTKPPSTTPPADQTGEQNKGENSHDDYELIDRNLDEFADAMSFMDAGEDEGQDDYVSVLDAETAKELQDAGIPTSLPHLDTSLDFTASMRFQEKIEEEKTETRKELSSLFGDMKGHPYRLHAVICHSGQTSSGHYWIWIYDFQKKVWHNFNDEVVTTHDDNVKVLADLNESSHPYYLAYVRADQVDEIVRVVERTPQTQTTTGGNVQTEASDSHVGKDGGCQTGGPSAQQGRHPLPKGRLPDCMDIDDNEKPDVEHLETRDG